MSAFWVGAGEWIRSHPAQLDSAWLQASLDHFGVRPTAVPSAFGNTGRNCDAVDRVDDTAPILPNLKHLPSKQSKSET